MNDLINKQALKEDLLKRGFYPVIVKCALRDAPVVDAVKVKHGRWIPQDDRYVKFMCSVCESKNYDGSGNYCPNCGAKMDGERKENETD